MFHHLEVTLTAGERLDTVRQCMLKGRFKGLAEDFDRMTYAAFFAETVGELSPEHEPAPELFAWLLSVFSAFTRHNPRLVAVAAGFQLLNFFGLQLQYNCCTACGETLYGGDGVFLASEGGAFCPRCAPEGAAHYSAGTRELIRRFLSLDWENPSVFSVKGKDLKPAEEFLLGYLEESVGRPLRSLDFLRQLQGTVSR